MVRTGAILVALAAFCWGLSGGIAALLMADGWSAYAVSFYRGAVGLVFAAIWLLARRRGSALDCPRFWAWSLVAGLGVAGNFTFYFMSIAEGSVAVAATLMYTAPVFVYAVAFAFGLEKVTAGKAGAIVMVLIGVVLLTEVWQLGAGSVTLMGAVTGLLAGVSYAVFIFGFRNAARRGTPQSALTIALAVLVVALSFPAGSDQLTAALKSPSRDMFVVLGVLGAGLSFMLYILGLKKTTPTLASVVAMVEPVTASLFGVMVLSETLEIAQVAGAVLILITVTILSVGGVQSKRQQRLTHFILKRLRLSQELR